MNLRLLRSLRASSSGLDFLHEGHQCGQQNHAYGAKVRVPRGSAPLMMSGTLLRSHFSSSSRLDYLHEGDQSDYHSDHLGPLQRSR